MFYELIQIGGLAFWGIVALFVLLEFLWVANEKWGWSIFGFVLTIAAFSVFSDVNMWQLITQNWLHLIIGFGIYVVIGVLWALFGKWYFFCKKRVDRYKGCLEQFNVKNMKEVPLDRKYDFYFYVKEQFCQLDDRIEYVELAQDNYRKTGDKILYTIMECERIEKELRSAIFPSPNLFKSKIIGWISAWPFSVLAHLVFDLMVDFYNNLYKLVKTFFDSVARLAFRGVGDEFKDIKSNKE